MLSVTEQAAEVLAKTLESGDIPDGQGLRLARNAAGEFGLAVDEKRDGDQIVETSDREVLYVDEAVSEAVAGAVLDVTEAPDGVRLALRMPGEEPPEGDAAPTA